MLEDKAVSGGFASLSIIATIVFQGVRIVCGFWRPLH